MSPLPQFAGISAFILTGGSSTRMGGDKALLEIAGEPMLVRTARLVEPVVASVAVIGPPERYSHFGLPVFPDDAPGLGPLGGISTALRRASTPWNLVLACDLPYLTAAWLENLLGRALESSADAVLPESARGAEPLCAVYHRRCTEPVAAALARGIYKVTDGLAACAVEKVAPAEWKQFDSDGCLFKNMNTPEDYQAARARFAGK